MSKCTFTSLHSEIAFVEQPSRYHSLVDDKAHRWHRRSLGPRTHLNTTAAESLSTIVNHFHCQQLTYIRLPIGTAVISARDVAGGLQASPTTAMPTGPYASSQLPSCDGKYFTPTIPSHQPWFAAACHPSNKCPFLADMCRSTTGASTFQSNVPSQSGMKKKVVLSSETIPLERRYS